MGRNAKTNVSAHRKTPQNQQHFTGWLMTTSASRMLFQMYLINRKRESMTRGAHNNSAELQSMHAEPNARVKMLRFISHFDKLQYFCLRYT